MSASFTTSPAWVARLRDNPLPWLLAEETPAVRHLALVQLLDRPKSDPEVCKASAEAMACDPIAAILEAQEAEGFWVKPGAGYSPKYRATVWQLIFLDQLGADRRDARVQGACDYVLHHSQAPSGGFSASGAASVKTPPPNSSAIHCLNGNLLRALIGFGFLDDPRVQRAIEWQARSITGEDFRRYYASGTSGPGFSCGANEKQPCAWGAIKAMLGLARIPISRREPFVQRAIDTGIEFLLSRDPVDADYPMGWGNTKPSSSWFRLGFPVGYVADVLQNLQVLCELGVGADPRLQRAIEWLLSKQDANGCWRNQNAYNGKTWTDFEAQGKHGKWVTLRACHVLKMVDEARSAAVREAV